MLSDRGATSSARIGTKAKEAKLRAEIQAVLVHDELVERQFVGTGAQHEVEDALGPDPGRQHGDIEAAGLPGQRLDDEVVGDGGVGVGAHALGDERQLGQDLPFVELAVVQREDRR